MLTVENPNICPNCFNIFILIVSIFLYCKIGVVQPVCHYHILSSMKQVGWPQFNRLCSRSALYRYIGVDKQHSIRLRE
jgi:hypothetical protein